MCLRRGAQRRRFYNPRMRVVIPHPSRLLWVLCCLASAAALAQKPAPLPRDAAPAAKGGAEQKIERIRHEDAGSRIDELRVGGETKEITVQPKGNAPAYEVTPEGSNRNPASTDRDRDRGSEGKSGWKLFKF